MNAAAVMLWGRTVTWPGVFALLGALSAMLLALGLWKAGGRRCAELAGLFPAAILLGLVLGRLSHWYCHPLQYASFREAMTDYFTGGFSLWGAFAGGALAAVIFAGTLPEAGLWEVLDALCPAAALGVAVGRLGALYDLSDRGKFVLETPALHRLPFAAYTVLSGQEGQWRFATFFVQSLWCLAVALLLGALLLTVWRKRPPGTASLFFALLYGAGQILLDSTRYDADFFRFNGFIHVPQLLSALAAAAALGVLCARSAGRYGWRRGHGLLLLLAVLSLAGCGVMEYLSQRYAERYALCYGGMAAFLALLCLAGGLLYGWKPDKKSAISTERRLKPGAEDLTMPK